MSNFKLRGASIRVVKYDNPKYRDGEPDKLKFLYLVVEAVNTVSPRVDEWLSESKLDQLMSDHLKVTIKPSN